MHRFFNGFAPVWSPVGTMPPEPTPFRSVEIVSGNGQTDTVRATLAQPLTVRVVHDDGTPQPGVTIRWNMLGPRPTNPPSLSSALATTDASGIASVQLTLGGSPGTVRVRAALTDGTARAGEVVFTATATAGPPVTLCCGGGGDYGLVVPNWSSTYSVMVRDGQGNSVPGIPITWTVTAGDGSVIPLPDTIVGTNPPLSVARAVHTFGPNEGPAEVTATAPTIAGAPPIAFTTTVVTAIVEIYGLYVGSWIRGDSVAVPSGRTVGWVWLTSADSDDEHNITFEDDQTQPTSSPTLQYGTFTRTFGGGPRTIRYRCTLHSTSFAEGEVGTVMVR